MIQRLPSNQQGLYILLDDLEGYKQDLGDLVDALNSMTSVTHGIRVTLKDQMEVGNRVRNAIIGMLVAVYVPLSFTTVSLIVRAIGSLLY